MDRSGQFPFIWNGADYLLQNPLSFHILIKRLFGKRQIQEGQIFPQKAISARRQRLQQQMFNVILIYTLKNNQEIFHTIIITFFLSLFHLKIINCLNSIVDKEKLTHQLGQTSNFLKIQSTTKGIFRSIIEEA